MYCVPQFSEGTKPKIKVMVKDPSFINQSLGPEFSLALIFSPVLQYQSAGDREFLSMAEEHINLLSKILGA